jgi:glycosyltransferase involved in cell wall biosynthesis
MGRLVPIKGTSLLLRALSTLPDMDLLVAGDGPERARLARLSNRLGVAARFIGAVPPKMRRDVMGACDALALPSCTLTSGRREGLPLVLPEAMAAGLPVVASDTGAVREFVSHRQNGLIFREGDVDGLRHCLRMLRTDVDMRESLRREGRASARARDWQNMLPMFESLLFAPHAPCSRNGLEEHHDF